MTDRVKQLRMELQSLYEINTGDEGRVLIRATKANHERVATIVKDFPLEQLLMEIAVVAANAVGDQLVQEGLRPADYWQDVEVAPVLAKRMAKALSDSSDVFTTAFQSVLRGQG